ncbi:hypothetical protein HETIRDRAFT_149154, partial [Heterobasidion irregulare TC 32-1]
GTRGGAARSTRRRRLWGRTSGRGARRILSRSSGGGRIRQTAQRLLRRLCGGARRRCQVGWCLLLTGLRGRWERRRRRRRWWSEAGFSTRLRLRVRVADGRTCR